MTAREKLLRADALVKAGQHTAAIDTYLEAADQYAGSGFSVKAIAVYRQVQELAERCEPISVEARTRALRALLSLYVELGLVADAERTRAMFD